MFSPCATRDAVILCNDPSGPAVRHHEMPTALRCSHCLHAALVITLYEYDETVAVGEDRGQLENDAYPPD